MAKQITINASNIHGGGATQVAVSIIKQISVCPDAKNITLVVSSFVLDECKKNQVKFGGFRDLIEKNIIGLKFFDRDMDQIFERSDVVFTVFGPLYFFRKPRKSVAGFAQPWIVYPTSDAYYKLSPMRRMIGRLKFFVQQHAFARNSDVLVVEAEHVRERLEVILPNRRVAVVPNALNSVFLDAISSMPDKMPEIAEIGTRSKKAKKLTLGYVGRAYSHKNLDIFPKVRRLLRENHGLEVNIKVTLPKHDWSNQTEKFKEAVENVGPLSLIECVEFYRSIDGVIFPSLLECFSAAPLEAMAMGLPLYASDRAFVRDFCGAFPFYFDPLEPASIANAVAESLALSRGELEERLQAGREHVLSRPSAAERARKVLEISNAA